MKVPLGWKNWQNEGKQNISACNEILTYQLIKSE